MLVMLEYVTNPFESKFGAQDIRELLTDFKLITSGSSIMDLGYAPGAKLQVACQSLGPSRNRGSVLGIDMKKGSSCALQFKGINCLC
ncbi:ribosomal RNA large subunit methyltransferase E isoform X3 [Cucumis melo var. makuwa]|uniref:Ribosomal RNA large subunit methyltransferase E isoform X3 n=1 Tax=Cucumis melo var. makuwa TaxID=1194695 RepID=A0A5D3C7P5_CUCMM|nr:ribosomal RNA large subunit methyltransferase E isoform X3 [Cucumis melo var. makuwa]